MAEPYKNLDEACQDCRKVMLRVGDDIESAMSGDEQMSPFRCDQFWAARQKLWDCVDRLVATFEQRASGSCDSD